MTLFEDGCREFRLVQTQNVKRVADSLVLTRVVRTEMQRFVESSWIRRQRYNIHHSWLHSAYVQSRCPIFKLEINRVPHWATDSSTGSP